MLVCKLGCNAFAFLVLVMRFTHTLLETLLSVCYMVMKQLKLYFGVIELRFAKSCDISYNSHRIQSLAENLKK